MEVIALEKEGYKSTFLVKGITPAIANTIRRAIIEEVPTMAIEDVEFRKNSSILYDEMVAHRLGLTPLVTDLKTYNLPDECKCKGEGCARCQAMITIKTSKTGIITAQEMKCKDENIKPVYPNMPITKLRKGQNLELEARAVLGKGKEHSKWSPAHVYYYNEAKITVNNDEKLLEEYRNKYPPQIFDKNGKIDRNLINKPELIDASEGVSKLVKIEKKEDNFVFVVESCGQLSPTAIIQEAVRQIELQLDQITEMMKA